MRGQPRLSVGVFVLAVVPFGACSERDDRTKPLDRSVGSLVSDAMLGAASGCDDCVVTSRARVTLPLTGKAFTRAKLYSRGRSTAKGVAIDDQGRAVNAEELLSAEGRAKVMRQGRLRDDAYAASLSNSSEVVPISIWPNIGGDAQPSRSDLAARPDLRRAHRDQVLANVRGATSKLTAWLEAHGARLGDRGIDGPVVTAYVPASVLADLGRFDGVGAVELSKPDVPAGGVHWFYGSRADAAQAIVASAAGQAFCTGEGGQPDSYGNLNVSSGQVFDSMALFDGHAKWTTELVAATTGHRMAPDASPFIAGWVSTSSSKYSAWNWCFNQWSGTNWVFNLNRSAGTGSGVAEGPRVEDMALDWYVWTWVALITASSGNCLSNANDPTSTGNCYTYGNTAVTNRSYNTLVVGASDDRATDTRADDTMADFSRFTNPGTTYNDFELPNLVAPGTEGNYICSPYAPSCTNAWVDSINPSASVGGVGTSASAPIVMGTVLLMKSRDANLDWWPEMIRTTVMATATRPVDGVRTEFLGAIDRRQGAGLLDAALAVQLADPNLVIGPGSAATPRGRNAGWYDFASAFPNPSPQPFTMPDGFSAPYNIQPDVSGRLRVVIAWDASPSGCQNDGSFCQFIDLDGDLDLWVSKFSNGAWQAVCNSASNDSSWELCDVPVSAGDVYKAEVRRYSAVKPGTYVGITWNTYDPNAE